jgi:radical SAM protein with 4Fe4S-binding SPASM domain
LSRLVYPFERFDGKEEAVQCSACRAARSSMYISPEGRILPCMTMAGTAADTMFESVLEKPLREILTTSHYQDMCRLHMGACIDHNEKCRSCAYRLACGAGCRAKACGETENDYLGIDGDACSFFLNGWYEKAKEAAAKYRDAFPEN